MTITAHTNDNIAKPQAVIVSLFEYGKAVAMAFGYSNRQFTFPVSDPKIWSPSSPALYNVTVAYGNDTIKSYMGFRTIEVGVVKGVKRPLLNGEVVFQMGLLDQGYWPDGIYTPPTKEAMIFDLEKTKEAGFNMLRKHVKVEPALFYRACDELGILVIQDMPSMRPANDGEPSSYEYVEFARQLEEMVQQLRSYPSIVTWVSFSSLMDIDRTDLARRSITKPGDRVPALLSVVSSIWSGRLTPPGSSTRPRAGATTVKATSRLTTITRAPSAAS